MTMDADAMRSGNIGGYEDSLYDQLEPPYLSKNAAMDSFEEIRLIDGWEGAVFEKYGEWKYLVFKYKRIGRKLDYKN